MVPHLDSARPVSDSDQLRHFHFFPGPQHLAVRPASSDSGGEDVD
jgi:hypothetical protein